MADRTALGFIGYILGGAAALVLAIGAAVVNANLSDQGKATADYGVSLSAKSRELPR